MTGHVGDRLQKLQKKGEKKPRVLDPGRPAVMSGEEGEIPRKKKEQENTSDSRTAITQKKKTLSDRRRKGGERSCVSHPVLKRRRRGV